MGNESQANLHNVCQLRGSGVFRRRISRVLVAFVLLLNVSLLALPGGDLAGFLTR
jgi:hypothetical protein